MSHSESLSRSMNEMTAKPMRIIAVDDEADALANLRELLQLLGYEVDIAENGRDALRLASQNAYDVALLDFRMPEMNGIELANRLKQLCPCMITMLVTAYLNPEQEHGVAVDKQVRRVISKPLDIDRLASLLLEVKGEHSVLIVDDDVDLCQNLKDAFEQVGFRVCLAHDADQAEKMLEQSGFQVVVVDYRIPGGDGIKLAAQIRRTWPERTVILMTGFRSEVSDRLDGNSTQVCYKPFDIGELLQTAKVKFQST